MPRLKFENLDLKGTITLWLCREIPFSDDIKAKASANRVELRGYVFDCAKEHTRAPRIVRVGAVQNAITTPTDRPVSEQVILFSSFYYLFKITLHILVYTKHVLSLVIINLIRKFYFHHKAVKDFKTKPNYT